MKSTNDLPLDPLGTIGAPIRDQKPATPDPISDFTTKKHDLINNQSTAIETIAETLRKSNGVVIEDGQEADWEGLCVPRRAFRTAYATGAPVINYSLTDEEAAELKRVAIELDEYTRLILSSF